MPVYTAPVRDTQYVLDHVVGVQNYSNLPGFAEATPDLIEAILTEGGGASARKCCSRSTGSATSMGASVTTTVR